MTDLSFLPVPWMPIPSTYGSGKSAYCPTVINPPSFIPGRKMESRCVYTGNRPSVGSSEFPQPEVECLCGTLFR